MRALYAASLNIVMSDTSCDNDISLCMKPICIFIRSELTVCPLLNLRQLIVKEQTIVKESLFGNRTKTSVNSRLRVLGIPYLGGGGG